MKVDGRKEGRKGGREEWEDRVKESDGWSQCVRIGGGMGKYGLWKWVWALWVWLGMADCLNVTFNKILPLFFLFFFFSLLFSSLLFSSLFWLAPKKYKMKLCLFYDLNMIEFRCFISFFILFFYLIVIIIIKFRFLFHLSVYVYLFFSRYQVLFSLSYHHIFFSFISRQVFISSYQS